jgi:hypothetical protein
VTNPIPRLTVAIDVYGDFFAAERSEWDSGLLLEGRFDAERAVLRFEAANAVPGGPREGDVKPADTTKQHSIILRRCRKWRTT